jgi:hypothetical protein
MLPALQLEVLQVQLMTWTPAPTAIVQDKALAGMDILVLLLATHMDSQIHSTRMDIEARHHQGLGEEWEDLVEAMDPHHNRTAKAEDTLLLPKINMPTMVSVVQLLDMAGRNLNVRIQTTLMAHANIRHKPEGNMLTTLVLSMRDVNILIDHTLPIISNQTALPPVVLPEDQVDQGE